MTEPDELERYEGDVTSIRIAELGLKPVQGLFDTAHLLEIHRRVFQDLPRHAPGQLRPAAVAHIKLRQLEAMPHSYRVYYAARSAVEAGLAATLQPLQGLREWHGLTAEDFSVRMADLYGDLDYLHPFGEGNSRTLRVFTAQLAAEAGYALHWNTANADAADRDWLYVARDVEVARRFLANANSEAQIKAYAQIVRLADGRASLQEVIYASLSPSRASR